MFVLFWIGERSEKQHVVQPQTLAFVQKQWRLSAWTKRSWLIIAGLKLERERRVQKHWPTARSHSNWKCHDSRYFYSTIYKPPWKNKERSQSHPWNQSRYIQIHELWLFSFWVQELCFDRVTVVSLFEIQLGLWLAVAAVALLIYCIKLSSVKHFEEENN